MPSEAQILARAVVALIHYSNIPSVHYSAVGVLHHSIRDPHTGGDGPGQAVDHAKQSQFPDRQNEG